MRIALFTDTFPPEINGVANSTYILSNELRKAGNEVYVVTTDAGSGRSRWNEDHTILRLAGVELKFLYGYVMTNPFHMLALEEIRKLNLDIIHAQTEFGVGIFARLCARQLHIPLVSTYHTTYEDYTHYINFLNSHTVDEVAKKGVARISKLYGDSSMEVIAPSQKTKDMLLGYHIRREISVIPTGLDLASFSPAEEDENKTLAIRKKYNIDPRERLVIYVGRLAQEKSMDLVIRGFCKAYDEGIQVKFLIVGGGPDLDNCRKMAEELGIADDVRVIGPVPSTEVPDYYRAADVFISASLSETQGMTYIEALASGLPLMVRHDEVVEDLVEEGKTGWYFEDEEGIAEALRSFLNLSDEQLAEYSRNAVEKAEPYSSKIFGQKVLEVYNRVIEDYKHQYRIEDVVVKGNSVQLYLISSEKEEMRLLVSLDDFANLGMREGETLLSRQVASLKKKEEGVKAYQKCLNRIAFKDRTRKEIYDWLTQNTGCDIETINTIVDKLENSGFLNDERYCKEQVSRMRTALAGRNKIIRTLQKKGIPYDMIIREVDSTDENEVDNAEIYARKVMKNRRNDSIVKLKNYLKTKLMTQGYSAAVADEAISRLDFSANEENETNALRRCLMKANLKYQRKYKNTELRNHIFRHALSQGFKADEIYAVMNEMEGWINDDEDS